MVFRETNRQRGSYQILSNEQKKWRSKNKVCRSQGFCSYLSKRLLSGVGWNDHWNSAHCRIDEKLLLVHAWGVDTLLESCQRPSAHLWPKIKMMINKAKSQFCLIFEILVVKWKKLKFLSEKITKNFKINQMSDFNFVSNSDFGQISILRSTFNLDSYFNFEVKYLISLLFL